MTRRKRLRTFAVNVTAFLLPAALIFAVIVAAALLLPSWFGYVVVGVGIILVIVTEWRRAGREEIPLRRARVWQSIDGGDWEPADFDAFRSTVIFPQFVGTSHEGHEVLFKIDWDV